MCSSVLGRWDTNPGRSATLPPAGVDERQFERPIRTW